MEWDELIAAVRACAGRTAVDVAALLLGLCRSRLAELSSALQAPTIGGRYRDELTGALSWLREVGAFEGVNGQLADALAAALERTASTIGVPVVAARCWAIALDEVCGGRFHHCVASRGERLQLAPGDPVPISQRNLRKWFPDSTLSSHPDSLDQALDELPRLRLAPSDFRELEVELRFADENLLDLLGERLHLGIAVPNAASEDFGFEEYEDCGRYLFHCTGPVLPQRQLRLILGLLALAEAQDLDAVVLPELCVTQQMVTALQDWMDAPGRRLSMVVAGSYHAEIPAGERRNRVEVLFPRAAPATHDKFADFHYVKKKNGPKYHENIVRHPARLTLHLTPRLCYAVLICKDLFSQTAMALLTKLQARLVLAPSFGEKTDPYGLSIAQVVQHAQAAVAIANMATDPPHIAVLGRPVTPEPIVTVHPKDVRPPLLVALRGGRVDIHPIAIEPVPDDSDAESV